MKITAKQVRTEIENNNFAYTNGNHFVNDSYYYFLENDKIKIRTSTGDWTIAKKIN